MQTKTDATESQQTAHQRKLLPFSCNSIEIWQITDPIVIQITPQFVYLLTEFDLNIAMTGKFIQSKVDRASCCFMTDHAVKWGSVRVSSSGSHSHKG